MSKAGASLATCYGPVSADVIAKAENIRLLILDVDGVLSDGIAVRFWTLQKVIDNIHRAADRQKILLVCKTPADFLTLVKGGVPVNRINVGNMHYANGKQQIAKTVSVDAGDIAAFNDLKAAGVECFVQGVPTEPAVDLFKLL